MKITSMQLNISQRVLVVNSVGLLRSSIVQHLLTSQFVNKKCVRNGKCCVQKQAILTQRKRFIHFNIESAESADCVVTGTDVQIPLRLLLLPSRLLQRQRYIITLQSFSAQISILLPDSLVVVYCSFPQFLHAKSGLL